MATAYVNQTPLISQVLTRVGVNYEPFACDLAKLVASFPGFIINDTLDLVRIPNHYMLVDFFIDFCALDSSTGVVSSVGDNGDSTKGAAGVGGFATGLVLGRSSAAGTLRAGGTGFVHGSIPWIYSIPVASMPTGGLYLRLKITTAPTGTAATTGIIYGWIAYSSLAPLEFPSGTGGVQPL